MKSIVLLILFLITTFILNVIFYYKSSDYRDFLKLLKTDKTLEVNTTKDKKDLLIKQIKEERLRQLNKQETLTGIVKETNLENIPDGGLEIKTSTVFGEDISKLKEKIEKEEKIELKQEMKLGKIYQDILSLFSKYNLEILELNTSLFDVTNEYPDEYFEYYSRDLTLYFFPTKTYEDVLDIFKVLSLDLPFSLNEINNFGDRSFYINLNSNISDSVVRIVSSYNGIIFGIKVKKSEYENIKKILKKL